MLRAIEAAEYIVWLSCQNQYDSVSNLKLQKLLFYAQGKSLAECGKMLFDARIEAWQHGPVIADIYHEYKRYQKEAIPCPQNINLGIYSNEQRTIMDKTYQIYAPYSAWELRNMTHDELLWSQVADKGVIPAPMLREYFLAKMKTRPMIVQVQNKSWDEVASNILEKRSKLWEKLAKV